MKKIIKNEWVKKLAVLGLFAVSLTAARADVTWDAGTGNWSDSAKWGGSLPTSADNVIFSDLNSAETITLGNAAVAGSLTFNNTGLTTLGTGTLKLYNGLTIDSASGGVAWGTNTSVVIANSQTWTNNDAAGKLGLPTKIFAGDTDVTLTLNSAFANNASPGAGVFNDSATGKLSLVFAVATNWEFKQNQSYSGTTTFKAGYVKLGSNATGFFGTSTVVFDGAATIAAGLGAGNILNNNIVAAAGSSSSITSAQNPFTLGGNITLNSTLTLQHGSSTADGGVITVNGVISGAGNLNISRNTGNLKNNTAVVLNGVNTYTGTTILGVNAIAQFSNGSALGSAAGDVSLAQNTILEYTGNAAVTTTRTIGLNMAGNNQGATLKASGAGAWTVSSLNFAGSNYTNKTLILSGTSTALNTVSANIVNNAANVTILTKNDTGTWMLTGNNTYTGATTVSAGTLLINGDSSGATGNVTVASAAKLGGKGTVGGITTVSAGATLALGGDNTTGALTFTKNLTLSGDMVIDVASASLYDSLVLNSGFTFNSGGTLTLSAINGFDWSGQETYELNLFGGTATIGGIYDIGNITVSGLVYGDDYELAWTNNNKTLVLTMLNVPEPGTLTLLGIGITLLFLTRRRKQS